MAGYRKRHLNGFRGLFASILLVTTTLMAGCGDADTEGDNTEALAPAEITEPAEGTKPAEGTEPGGEIADEAPPDDGAIVALEAETVPLEQAPAENVAPGEDALEGVAGGERVADVAPLQPLPNAELLPIVEEPGAAEVPPLAASQPTLTPEMRAMIDAGDVVAGRTYVTRCAACHALDPGGLAPAAAQVGPSLYGMFGARIGAVDGFEYSDVFLTAYSTGVVWSAARLELFLADPEGVAPGTAMDVAGVADAQDRANIIAFIRSLAINPVPLEGDVAPAAEGNPELLALIAEADVNRGQSLAARCSGCHRFVADDAILTGPNLYGIVGDAIGGRGGFTYSAALRALNENGEVWTYDRLNAFLASPAVAIPGTRMGFAGIDDIRDRAAVIAYLRQLAPTPYPLAVETGTEVGVARDGLRPVSFTLAQAAAGEAGYLEWCVGCHNADLRGEVDLRADGVGVAPALVGPNFEHRWFGGTVGRLFAHVSTEEPRDALGEVAPEGIAAVLAYVLERNGFQAGAESLPPDAAVLDNTGFFQD
ncbi:MAG: c-type cytochrome [Alphaproteobacteria bacterium]